jgi:hypothetical protein
MAGSGVYPTLMAYKSKLQTPQGVTSDLDTHDRAETARVRTRNAPAISHFPGKFNLFQRMMLRWRDLHPYNAVHAVPWPAKVDHSHLGKVIADVLTRRGIAGLCLDSSRRRYVYTTGPANVDLEVRVIGGPPEAALAAEMERQINRPFQLSDQSLPMRFFVLDRGASGGAWFGIAYDHFIAGGDSLARVLTDIMRAYSTGVLPAEAFDVYPPTYTRLVMHHTGAFLRALAHMPELARDSKRAFRPCYRDVTDAYNSFALLRIPQGGATALRARAKRLGVTLHDLMLAVLLQTLSAFAPERRHDERRSSIAVAAIVNLRSTFGARAENAFGQFLASLRIAHPVPAGITLDELALAVHAATSRIKRERLHLRTLFALMGASIAWPFMDTSQRHRFYAKHYPASAGITMLDSGRYGSGAAGTTAYVRAVSTGPLLPAVLAISTCGSQLSIGVSYRRTVYDATLVAALEGALRVAADLE